MSNATKISKLSTKTSLSKLKAKASKLDKLQASKSKLVKSTAKKISIDDVFVSKPLVIFNDGIGILDSFKSSTIQPISFNENISFNEELKFSFKTVFQDSISPEDIATTIIIINKLLLSDTISVDDELLISSLEDIQLLDNITAFDNISLKDLLKFSNTVILNEDFINNISAINNLSNTVLLNQTFSTILNNSINLETEPSVASVGDSLTTTMSMLNNNLETVNLNDSFSTKLATQVNFDDGVTLEDSISLESNLIQQLSDATTVDDTSTNKLDAKVNLSSSTSVTDSFLNNVHFKTSLLGELTISDSTGAAKQYLSEIPEPIEPFNLETDIYNTSISYFIYGVFVKDELVAIVIRNPLLINLISPTQSSNALSNVSFSWQPDEFSNQYELQVATTSNFSSGFIVDITTALTTYTPIAALNNNTYYWRVRGKNSINGKVGPFPTVPRSFTVITLAVPNIIFPANNQLTRNSLTINWNSVQLATSYDVQVSTNNAFNNIIETGNTANLSYFIGGLNYNTPYYLRVRSVSGNTTSAWSPTRIFTPLLVSLANNVATQDNIFVSNAIKLLFNTDSITSSDNLTSEIISPQITTDIYPYQLLSDDPTTKTLINWVDDTSTSDGAQQTLQYYSTNPNVLTNVQATGTVIPNSSKYVYSVNLSGLTENTTYTFKVIKTGLETNLYTFKTFKSTLDANTLRVGFLSDIHIDYDSGGSMNDSNRMSHIRNQNPDILCLIGDVVSNSHTPDTTKSNLYITFFKEHINTYMSTNRVLVPMVNVPGNHDVGERNPANTNLSKTVGYFQLFWNTFKTYNGGNNHGTIKVGNYLKLVGIDLFSSDPATNATMINNITDNTEYVIPFTHFPILPSTTRQGYDADYFNPVIQSMAPALYNNAKIKAYFSGHLHTRYDSKRWKVVNAGSAPSNSTSLGSSNYIVQDLTLAGKKEFGQGYRNNRALNNVTIGNNLFGNTAWYINNVQSDANLGTFYVVELKANNEMFNVKQYNSNSSGTNLVTTVDMLTLESNNFALIIPEAGDTVPKEWTVFKWNPVEGAQNVTTKYTVGVTNSTNVNDHPENTRVRSSIGPGTFNTVLTSTSPSDTAPSFSITIADALVSSDSTQITFRQSAGVSQYIIQFCSDSGFTTPLSNQFGLNSEGQYIITETATNGLYPKSNRTLDLTQFNFTNGTYYWRIRVLVPSMPSGEQLRNYTVNGNFTISSGGSTSIVYLNDSVSTVDSFSFSTDSDAFKPVLVNEPTTQVGGVWLSIDEDLWE